MISYLDDIHISHSTPPVGAPEVPEQRSALYDTGENTGK